MPAVQRIKQGVRALVAFARPADFSLAEAYLTPAQLAHFQRLDRSEQHHSLNVLRDVLAQGGDTPHDLAVAALLHDIGKTRYRLAVWQRTLAVLVKKVAPRLEARWSMEGDVTFWRKPFIVRRHHPAWGADILQACGGTARAIWLVAHHAEDPARWQDHPHHALLMRLQAADDKN